MRGRPGDWDDWIIWHHETFVDRITFIEDSFRKHLRECPVEDIEFFLNGVEAFENFRAELKTLVASNDFTRLQDAIDPIDGSVIDDIHTFREWSWIGFYHANRYKKKLIGLFAAHEQRVPAQLREILDDALVSTPDNWWY